MTAGVSGAASTATASATRVDVFPTLATLLCTEFAEARRTGGRSGGWAAHADLGQGGLVAAVGARLGWCAHGDSEVLLLLHLLHLLGELVVVDLGRDIGHLALHLEVAELLLRLDHTHVNILLVRGGNLLLLLLEDLDLLCDGELFHCAAVSNGPKWLSDSSTYSSAVSALTDCGDAQCADDDRRDPWGPAGLVADP